MRENIDSCHKESESRTEYPEQNTSHFNNVANITVNSNSVTPQKKKNGIEEDHQEDCNIIFDKNGANKSMNASETIELITIKTIEKMLAIKLEKFQEKQLA